jgi:uncharacterized membrane protein
VSKNTYNICRKAVAAAVGMAVGMSVAMGNMFVPLAAVLIGMGILYVCRRQVKEVLTDERNRQIAAKAARVTLAVYGPVMAVVSTVLLVLSRGAYPELEPVGLTLAYSTAAVVVLYDILYYYFERKS